MGIDNPIHIAFLLIVLLLVFGAKRLPEMGRSVGSGLRGFKDALGGEVAQPLPAQPEPGRPQTEGPPRIEAAAAPVSLTPATEEEAAVAYHAPAA